LKKVGAMGFDIQVTHSVTEVGQSGWDSLSGGRPFASYRWYRFGEAVLADCSPTYVTLLQEDRPLARATFWLKCREWLQITSPVMRYGAERLLRRWPLFTCEAPLASASGLILPESPLRAAALKAIAETSLKLGKEMDASFSLFGYLDDREVNQPGWPKEFSAVSFPDAETQLLINWHSYDEYLRSLAKSTRRNIRLHGEQAAKMGVVVTIHPDVQELERVVTLVQDVECYHRVSQRPWTRAMLENAGMVDSAWIAARIDGRLVGCCSLIGDGDVQIATLLGLDYSVPQFIYVYYQIMYAAVRCAIERGGRILDGGGGAYELKRRLGFQKLPDDYLLVAAAGKSFRLLFRILSQWMGLQKPSGTLPDTPND